MNLNDARVCLNCGQVLVPHGLNWIHFDGYFRCPTGGWANPVHVADALAQEDLDEAYDEGFRDGETDAQRGMDEALDEAYEEGYAEGRKDMEKEIHDRGQAAPLGVPAESVR